MTEHILFYYPYASFTNAQLPLLKISALAMSDQPTPEAIRRDTADCEFLNLCDAQSQSTGKHWWTLSLAKRPQDPQTDQTTRHLIDNFSRKLARFRRSASGNSVVGTSAESTH